MCNFFYRGILNVHASLLPKLRGAAPIIHAIRNGESVTGCTIMNIRPRKFDVGEIILQKETLIGADELMPSVHDRLAQLGAKLLLDCIHDLPQILHMKREQCEEDATYAPKIDEQFTRIRWESMTAKQVYDLYRSLYSFKSPTTLWNKDVVKLKDMRLCRSDNSCEFSVPGKIRYSWKQRIMTVACADNKEIEILKIGIGQKSGMSATDFNNGFVKNVNESERKFR